MRVLRWRSSVCTCWAFMDVDSELQPIFCHPCSETDNVYCEKVAEQNLQERVQHIRSEWHGYKQQLDGYLSWAAESGVFFRPKNIAYANNDLTAHQAMQDWERAGVTELDSPELPCGACEEPDLLARYVQGKRCREFQIEQWKADTQHFIEGNGRDIGPLFFPEEFVYRFTDKEFRALFGRDPDPDLLRVCNGSHLQGPSQEQGS